MSHHTPPIPAGCKHLMENFTAHVALPPFYNDYGVRRKISSFQLLNRDKLAVMVCDFEDGEVVREAAAGCVPVDVGLAFRGWAYEQEATLSVRDFSI